MVYDFIDYYWTKVLIWMLIAYQLPFEDDFDDFLLKILQKLILFNTWCLFHKLAFFTNWYFFNNWYLLTIGKFWQKISMLKVRGSLLNIYKYLYDLDAYWILITFEDEVDSYYFNTGFDALLNILILIKMGETYIDT